MAFAEKKSSGKYQGRYRNAEGKIRSAGVFTQKKEAEREAARLESEQRRPGAVDLDGGKIRWGDWFDKWSSDRHVAYATDKNYVSTAKNHVRPYWGDTRLSEIEQLDVNRWVKSLQRDGASPYTIRNAVTLFKTTLKAAVDDNRLGRNPAQNVRIPDMPQATERYMTFDEVKSVTFHLNGLNSLLVWTAVYTGMRFGEIAGLHWSRLDLERGVIQVVEKYDQQADVIDPVPKDKEKRLVPLPDELVDMLTRHRDSQRSSQRTCGLTHRAGRCTSDLVFRGPRGAAVKSSDWGRVGGPWRTALDLAGIRDRVRPHDLRHTYASWLIQDGTPTAEIARVMGHSDTEITRRYAHLSDEGYDKVRDALSRRGGERRTQTGTQEITSALHRQRRANRRANSDYTPLHAVPEETDEDAM